MATDLGLWLDTCGDDLVPLSWARLAARYGATASTAMQTALRGAHDVDFVLRRSGSAPGPTEPPGTPAPTVRWKALSMNSFPQPPASRSPEPLRWTGIRAMTALMASADRSETRTGKTPRRVAAVQRLIGN